MNRTWDGGPPNQKNPITIKKGWGGEGEGNQGSRKVDLNFGQSRRRRILTWGGWAGNEKLEDKR